MSKTSYQRQGDTIVRVTVELSPAAIDWQEILDAIEIVPDDLSDAPWDNCDGYEHDLCLMPINDRKKRNGYAAFNQDGLWVTVKMDHDQDLYNWYRQRGASKGVAEQLTRHSMHKRIEQLIDWHRNGWEWWTVRGELHGCFASVGGVDDYRYAQDCRGDIAHELAGELRALGYEIKGEPDSVENNLAKHDRIEHNLNLFNMN